MMFKIRTNICKYFILLFFFIILELKAADEFDFNLLNERLNRLENEISDIQKSLYSPEANTQIEGDKQLSTKYQRRLNKMENDFAKMNGKFEEIFFRIDQLQEKLDKITSDVDFRLSTESSNNTGGLPLAKRDRSNETDTIAYPDNTSNVNTSGGDTEILGTITEQNAEDQAFEVAKNFQTSESLFDYGIESLKNLNYADAENAFKGFIKKYPNDKKIPSAYFWLGESLFVRNDYNEAVLAYGEVIKKFKKHKRAPESLLKIGIAFSNLDKKKESCDALKKIIKQYPETEKNVLKKTNYIIEENNC